ncbi:fimbrial protein [Serratia marcescens]|uniref:Fimbrial protein n=1 Tax=Serratia marcescens TaxID=615 RepID=A0AAP8TX15_SERMA|nr:fimbrial protein [Serratia marcescens]MBH3233351.1 type 1 fimbrial protein [Serratia marcescens]POP17319.1 pilin [Serratia marcescens]
MRIKNTALIVFSCLFSLVAMSAQASQSVQGWGRVNMQGSIIDTACAIAVESREQTVDMGITPLADIARDGQGNSRAFSIELVNCVLARPGRDDWKQFQVTFDGDAEGALFGVRGEASGVALQITDEHGNVAIPGQPLPLTDIVPGDRQLNYALKLMANRHALKSGDYFSAIRFKLDYF